MLKLLANIPLERTAGSHSLAAAAQRERWADRNRTAESSVTCSRHILTA